MAPLTAEGNAFAQVHAADGRVGGEHLTHTGAALGAFVFHHFGSNSGLLEHTAIIGQVALEDSDAAALGEGLIKGSDDLRITVDYIRQVFCDGLAVAMMRAISDRPFLGSSFMRA